MGTAAALLDLKAGGGQKERVRPIGASAQASDQRSAAAIKFYLLTPS